MLQPEFSVSNPTTRAHRAETIQHREGNFRSEILLNEVNIIIHLSLSECEIGSLADAGRWERPDDPRFFLRRYRRTTTPLCEVAATSFWIAVGGPRSTLKGVFVRSVMSCTPIAFCDPAVAGEEILSSDLHVRLLP